MIPPSASSAMGRPAFRSMSPECSMLTPSSLESSKARIHDDLDLTLRIRQGFESVRDPAQSHHRCYQGLRVNPALGDIMQRRGELIRRVPVDELEFELFYDG